MPRPIVPRLSIPSLAIMKHIINALMHIHLHTICLHTLFLLFSSILFSPRVSIHLMNTITKLSHLGPILYLPSLFCIYFHFYTLIILLVWISLSNILHPFWHLLVSLLALQLSTALQLYYYFYGTFHIHRTLYILQFDATLAILYRHHIVSLTKGLRLGDASSC